MGLEKRDYMAPRDPGLGGRWAVLGVSDRIVIANIVVFLAWQLPPARELMRDHFLVSWSGLFEHGRVWTTITAAFSHEGLWHLVWNMLYLHWFGIELESIYGRRNFLLLYLHSGLVASLAHVAWAHGFGPDVPALGASGAVMAVVVVTAIFYPHRTISLWFFLPVPLWLLAAVKLLGDFAGLFQQSSGVGHAAHLGGALAGVFFWWFDCRLFASPGQEEWLEEPWPGWRAALAGLFRRRPKPIVEPQRIDPHAERVDDLLRKITREGMASLTPDELEFLKAASQRRK